jgi:hypothetical protein
MTVNMMTYLGIRRVSSTHNNRITEANIIEFWYFQDRRRTYSLTVTSGSHCVGVKHPLSSEYTCGPCEVYGVG